MAAHGGERVYAGIPADDRARIQHAAAADFGVIAQHCADFDHAGGDCAVGAMDDHGLAVALDVGRDGTRAHVRLIAQDGIADVVVVGDFHVVE